MQIDAHQLKEKLATHKAIILLDVREEYEHKEFNIGGKLIPLSTLPYSTDALDEWKSNEIVVYCRSGVRSLAAQQLLIKRGFEKVINLNGGVIGWIEAFGKTVP
jgi:rhodanese-related sulfurtransferase